MTTAMTYDSLVDDVKTYCERNDEPFLAQIPRFIMLAENRIAAEAKPLGFLRVVTGQFSGAILAKPTRWRMTRSISYMVDTERRFIYPRGYEHLRSYWPDATVVATPEYYADYDYEHYLFAPTPDQDYTFELRYFERPDPLSSDQQTNWTTQYAPQVLLYAVLMEAMPFLKTSERIAEFQGLYTQALSAVTKEDSSRSTDAAATRN